MRIALAMVALILGTCVSAAKADNRGVAVVELFTSEGCSSCPPADRLVSKLNAEEQKGADKNTVFLSWHVDYWNKLGWPDRFSSAAFSKRQQLACRELHPESYYTPQMIVNGREEFNGSDEASARKAINASHAKSPIADVTVKVSPGSEKNKLNIVWTSSVSENIDVDIALTEDGILSDVVRGENAGEKLHHDAVVRAVMSVALPKSSSESVALDVPADAKLDNCHIVAIVRKHGSVAVLGAAQTLVVSEAR